MSRGRPTVLLANETGHTPNPGCRAVRNGFQRLFSLAGVNQVDELPVGYWSEYFKDLAPEKSDRVVKKEGFFPVGTESAPLLNASKWEAVRDNLLEDSHFNDALDSVDALVINAEGSMHHNLPRALAMCAMIDAARSTNKPVAVMNASIQAMSTGLLSEVFTGIGLVHVREKRSLDTMSFVGDRVFCAPDIAVLSINALRPRSRKSMSPGSKKCLISSGVLVSENSIWQTVAAARRAGLDPFYLSIGDGGEAQLADKVCSALDLPLVRAGDLTLERLVDIISNCRIAISGRHHINIFLMSCGVPFIPIPSNTWKIEATLDLAGYPVSPILSLEAIDRAISDVLEQRELLSEASSAAFARYHVDARLIVERFQEWMF